MNECTAYDIEMMWLALDDTAANAARVALRRRMTPAMRPRDADTTRTPWSAAMRAHDAR